MGKKIDLGDLQACEQWSSTRETCEYVSKALGYDHDLWENGAGDDGNNKILRTAYEYFLKTDRDELLAHEVGEDVLFWGAGSETPWSLAEAGVITAEELAKHGQC